jgi:hypothetical protein
MLVSYGIDLTDTQYLIVHFMISPLFSDFCFGNSLQSDPALTLTNILLEERGITNGHMIYEAFAYYQSVSYCILNLIIACFCIHLKLFSHCMQHFVRAVQRLIQ